MHFDIITAATPEAKAFRECVQTTLSYALPKPYLAISILPANKTENNLTFV